MSKTAFVFPGQGSQKAGMGKDFYENSELSREVFDQASELLKLDMKALCFEENDKLNQTEYTQAALVTTCLAMTAAVKKAGLTPDISAGLSLGEYCALVMSGTMKQEDAITMVRKRGILMAEAVPNGVGAMSAIMGMEGDAIEKVLEDIEGAYIANYNCPGQIVITGYKEAVEKANAALKEAGAKRAMMLNVSGPFHSPLLKTAGEALGRELENITLSPLNIPYVTNVTAKPVTETTAIRSLLAAQVASPVRWQQSVEWMIAEGTDTFVEIGPGKTLSGFIKKINRDVKICHISDWKDIDEVLSK